MRVLVCGGRDFTDTEFCYSSLDAFHEQHGISVLIEGDAIGADRISGQWAKDHGINNLKFPADWVKHGRAAGPIRNAQMLVEGQPDVVIAFPGGRGTADMISRSKAAGLKVIEIA